MKLPHWLRHAWGDWQVASHPQAKLVDVYEVRVTANDIRSCMLCGRRQLRRI